MAERKIEAWNTREDLILVCAVQRHGFGSWHNVSMELQRQAETSLADFFTPEECMSRFQILHKRFVTTREAFVDDGVDEKTVESMRKEFTKLHVEVLRRQLETSNQNIELLKEKLERQTNEIEEAGEVAAEVAMEANVGGDEPSLKMDGGDEPIQVNEANQLDATGVRGNCNMIQMNRVLKRLKRSKTNRLFFHKLHSQKTNESYRKTIRQHMDLDIIQSMMNQDNEYTHSFHTFFRDLLLIINNAIVFFKNKSEEHIVAIQLRKVVREEMKKLIYVQPVVFGMPAASSGQRDERKPRRLRKDTPVPKMDGRRSVTRSMNAKGEERREVC